ncbi:RNA polymerase sigma factor SigF [Streptomyces graminilatus]|uniref:RNA polymerase sigma factor SigF n=1 Tax=Streptomyces graminilatus TaxID=1464070 RepID=UPI00099E52D4|nr:RNA polymerase sigma factor SigF [Streptomyces graminilatus]
MRDEERGTRGLPAAGGGPDGPRGTADAGSGTAGVSGIPEQARPHPEDAPAKGDPAEAGFMDDGQLDLEGAVQSAPLEGPSELSPVRADARTRGGSTGGTMSEHERDDAQDAQQTAAQAAQAVQTGQVAQATEHSPTDRSGARALFYELRALPSGSAEYAELRNRLVRMHLPLVEHLARRFRNRGEPLDDLTQVATIGLIKSVDRFDPDRGVEFSTYATPTVVGEIKRHFRDKGWAVRVPRRLQELRLSLTTATAELSQRHGRSPTVHELAEKLGISEEEVLEGLESANAYSTLSLDVPDTDDESPAVADTLGSYDEALEGVEYRESLKPLLEDLPPREKRILLLRFFGNMTQSQIAQEVGISQMHVSRLLARTLAQLREKLLVEE